MMGLHLKSPNVKEGEYLDDRFTGYGANISPEFHISGIDRNAVSMILTLDDHDHPRIPDFNHWIAFNIKPVNKIPCSLPKGFSLTKPIQMNQGRAYGNYRYRGPKTPKGETHTYIFTLYTLDCRLDGNLMSNKRKIMASAEGHILQKAELKVLYSPAYSEAK
ncbi:MAG: YbhB/YbcL family Raf kinase inhibitor-like protein [Bacilli bacterium]|nr:YbhB/YbcL family Raf kinase inhibitor-like protein [Bacilli bacterium]